jgi:hypothetical protein
MRMRAMGEEVSPSARERSSLYSHAVVEGRLVGRQNPCENVQVDSAIAISATVGHQTDTPCRRKGNTNGY